MADKKPEAGEEGSAAKKKPKLLLFIIIGVTVLVLGGGVVTFLLLKKSAPIDEDDEEVVATEKKRSKKEPAAAPVFVKLEPFTVKLQVEQQDAYLQATPELRVLDVPIGDRVKQYTPEIRHKVLLIMSGKKASELGTPQGVQRLSNEMRSEINLIIDGPKPRAKGKAAAEESAEPSDQAGADDSVQAVLFTSFIIQ
jgi:flagellar FliL protein